MSFNNYANREIDYEITLQNMAFANNRDITASIGNRSVLSPPDQKTVEEYRRRTLPQGVVDPTTGNKTLYRTVQPVVLEDVDKLISNLEIARNDNKNIIKTEKQIFINLSDDLRLMLSEFNHRISKTKQLIEELYNNLQDKTLEYPEKSIINFNERIKRNNLTISNLEKEIIEEGFNVDPAVGIPAKVQEMRDFILKAKRINIEALQQENIALSDYILSLRIHIKHDLDSNEMKEIEESKDIISISEKKVSELNKLNELLDRYPQAGPNPPTDNEVSIKKVSIKKEIETLLTIIDYHKNKIKEISGNLNQRDINNEQIINQIEKLDKKLDQLNIAKKGAIAYLESLKEGFDREKAEYEYNNRRFEELDKVIAIEKQKNKEKVAKYQDDFKELNQGLTNIPVQEQGESDELFYQRLQAYTGQSFTDTDILANIDYRLTLEIKEKFKELFDTNNPLFLSIIESVINTPELSTTELKQNFLRRWTQFKIAYLKVYEKDNKFVKPNDIIDLWLETQSKTPIGSSSSSSSSSSSTKPVDKRDIKDEEKVKENKFDNTFKFTFDDKDGESNIIYYVYFQVNKIGDDIRYNIAISKTGQIGTFQAITVTSQSDRSMSRATIEKTLTNTMINTYRNYFKNTNNYKAMIKKFSADIIANFPPDDIDDRITITETGKKWRQTNFKKTQNGAIIGFGIKMPEVEKFANFGKVMIMLDKLIKTNTLVIKDKRGASILGVRNILVSDHMVNIITKLIADPKADISSDYIELSPADLEIYSALMELSGLHKILKVPKPNIKVYKDKLNVIVGEIESGNDNLTSDLQDCLNKLVALKAITKTEAKRYFNDLTQ